MGPSALLLLSALLQAQVPGGELRGTVVGQRPGGEALPLAFAMVEVSGPGATQRAVVTDGQGRYRVAGLPTGLALEVRALHVGFSDARVEISLAPGGAASLDLVLARKPIELAALLVQAGRPTVPEVQGRTGTLDQASTRAELGLRVLELGPGLAESGLAEAAGRPPGGDPSEPGEALFLRGSAADMKLVLLDGAPLYAPFHLGGLLPSFDERTLRSASRHVGGAPARYDGGLSYVLDLRTRSPSRDALHVSGSADLMGAAATLETPLGPRAGALLSGRALHGLQSRLAGGRASPYGYVDALLRGEVDLGASERLSLLAFSNEESVRLGLGEPSGLAHDPAASAGAPRRPGSATWANSALSLSWAAGGEGRSLEVGASATRYHADLPVPADPSPTAPPPGAGARESLIATGETDRLRLTADGTLFGEAGDLRLGLTLDRTWVELSARRFSVLTGPGSLEYERRSSGGSVGGYAELTRRLAPGLSVRSGLRLDAFDPGGAHGALRLALLWNLTGEALLSLAGGRYHQLVRTTDAEVDLAVGGGATAGTGGGTRQIERFPLLALASADHFVLSLDQQLTPRLRITSAGFYKRFAGLGGFGRENLNSSGVDLRVLRHGESLTGWLGYSLSWHWDDPDAAGRSADFSGRHLLSVGGTGRPWGPLAIDLALAYSDGLPLTSIPFAARADEALSGGGGPTTLPAAASGPLRPTTTDAFLRVDLEVSAALETHWFGRAGALRPYVRVLNALDRRDALFYYFEPWRDPGLRPLAELSVIPVAGVEWRF